MAGKGTWVSDEQIASPIEMSGKSGDHNDVAWRKPQPILLWMPSKVKSFGDFAGSYFAACFFHEHSASGFYFPAVNPTDG